MHCSKYVLGFVLIAQLIACGQPEAPSPPPPPRHDAAPVAAPSPPEPPRPAVDNRSFESRLEAALAQRRTRVLALPPPKVRPVGRCAVQIEPVTSNEIVREELTRRGGWRTDTADFSDLTGALTSVYADPRGRAPSKQIVVTDDVAADAAIAFFVDNYDLFGLDAHDIWATRIEVDDPAGGTWPHVVFRGERALHGAELFRHLDRTWRVSVFIGQDGSVHHAMGHTFLLPPIELCRDPKLSPSSPDLLREIVGKVVIGSDIGGNQHPFLPIEADDVEHVTLTVFRERKAELVFRLAYQIDVAARPGPMPWSFVVDADDGRFLASYPRYQT